MAQACTWMRGICMHADLKHMRAHGCGARGCMWMQGICVHMDAVHVDAWDAVHVDACGCTWMHVDARGCMWMHVDACGCMWMQAAHQPKGLNTVADHTAALSPSHPVTSYLHKALALAGQTLGPTRPWP